jgi:hypothetical protein
MEIDMDDKQKLIDIIFDLAHVTWDSTRRNIDTWKTQEEYMEWVASKLESCGFETTPVGASWGVLKKDKPELKKYYIVYQHRNYGEARDNSITIEIEQPTSENIQIWITEVKKGIRGKVQDNGCLIIKSWVELP